VTGWVERRKHGPLYCLVAALYRIAGSHQPTAWIIRGVPLPQQGSAFDFRLQVESQPLDVIVNPSVVRRLGSILRRCMPSSPQSPPQWQGSDSGHGDTPDEPLVSQPSTEARGGAPARLASTWDIHLDVTAPQLIAPVSVLAQGLATVHLTC